MTEVLSQDEIDQLLTAINAGDTEPEDFKSTADSRKIKSTRLLPAFLPPAFPPSSVPLSMSMWLR